MELNGKNTHVFQQLELYAYCSMNKQYVEEIQNRKRLTW